MKLSYRWVVQKRNNAVLMHWSYASFVLNIMWLIIHVLNSVLVARGPLLKNTNFSGPQNHISYVKCMPDSWASRPASVVRYFVYLPRSCSPALPVYRSDPAQINKYYSNRSDILSYTFYATLHTWCILYHGATTVETLYNTINFCWSTHKRHSIARPKGRGMGCLLWVQRATYSVDLSILSSIKYLL